MSLIVDIQRDFGRFRLNAAFEAGSGTLGLLGASGCGKSMTLKCIAGIETPDTGYIALDGITLFDSKRKINLPPQARQVGYLFQNYALFPNMTVKQNILCGLHAEKNQNKREQALREMIVLMRLEGLEKHRPAQLSGGQQQRAALARILVNQPKLLMLDEPFSALDNHLREKLQIEMKELLVGFGRVSLLVTHNRDEAYRICDHIALMDDGRILTSKSTKALFLDPGSVEAAVLTGCRNIASARKTGAHEVYVADWGIHLKSAQPVRDDLQAIGIHAHAFGCDTKENCFPVQLGSAIEEPFETLFPFRYAQQSAKTPELWWRCAKEHMDIGSDPHIGVAPEHIFLFYKQVQS